MLPHLVDKKIFVTMGRISQDPLFDRVHILNLYICLMVFTFLCFEIVQNAFSLLLYTSTGNQTFARCLAGSIDCVGTLAPNPRCLLFVAATL